MPEIIERRVEYTTPWFQMVTKTVSGLPGIDGEANFYALKPDDYVLVVAITDTDQVVLVRQYRPVVEAYTVEFPSGHLDPGETTADTARRELLEETAYIATELELLGCLTTDAGRLDNRMWCYYAPGVTLSLQHQPEAGLEIVLCSRDKLFQMVLDGTIDEALHLAPLLLAVLQGKLPLQPR